MTDIKKILITSALPYINGIKHLGNLSGSLLPADIHARKSDPDRLPRCLIPLM